MLRLDILQRRCRIRHLCNRRMASGVLLKTAQHGPEDRLQQIGCQHTDIVQLLAQWQQVHRQAGNAVVEIFAKEGGLF
jgi:hypothetical protein